MSYVPELLAERRAILRAGLDLAALNGLEIAPLAWPTVRRDEGRIRYIDHFDTQTLRARYRDDPNVPTEDIVPVDALWGEQTLAECLGGETVDYIIASHVGEHVPDLVTWLAECDAVLAPGGELRLVLPDRRFSPDALRRDTNLTDVLAAHLLRARRPQVREVLDFMLHDAPAIDRTRLYRGTFDLGTLRPRWTVEQALSFARRVRDVPDHYEDVHCWAFTPRSFARLMRTLAGNGLTRFACSDFRDSRDPWFEFFVFLRATDDREAAADSWRRMEQAAADPLPGSGEAAATDAEQERIARLERDLAEARTRIAAMEASTSWRVTAPLRALARRRTG